MSSWGSKLEKKLSLLGDSASKESIQTLANWIAFNRKHAVAFSKVLCDSVLTTSTESRQWLYWQLVNEVLLANLKDSSKWERGAALRTALGEATIVPAIEGLGNRTLADKVESLLKQWDEHNVFGGPTLIGQIRRLLSSKAKDGNSTSVAGSAPLMASSSDAPPAVSDAPAKATDPLETQTVEPPEATASDASPVKASTKEKSKEPETTPDIQPTASKEQLASSAEHSRRGSLSSMTSEVTFDFESRNVPPGKVDSREFLDPCKAVATLQIARDVRNDTPVQMNSMLSNLPSDILELCSKKKPNENGDGEDEYDEETIRDCSLRIPEKLLETDLDDQLQTIKTFQDIIRQQQAARQKLIYLLLKSRCQFGSQEAAEQFYQLKDISTKLRRKRQLLGDALELEGLDNELDHTDFEKPLQDLSPLSWYTPSNETNNEVLSQKKARIES